MKIKIEIPQIRCRKVTFPRTDADEIYVAYAVAVAASDGHAVSKGKVAIAGGRVSSIKTGVKKNDHFTFDNLSAVVDVGGSEGAFLAIAVLEKDDGNLHTKLKADLSGILSLPEFDWKAIKLPENLTDWRGWVKTAWKAAGEVFRQIMRDDNLGLVEIPIMLDADAKGDDGDWTGLRELRFKRFGGDYRVSVRLSRAD